MQKLNSIYKDFTSIKGVALLVYAVVVYAAFSIANETIYGNNRHLYLPIIGFGLFYCAKAYFFGRLSKTELEMEEQLF